MPSWHLEILSNTGKAESTFKGIWSGLIPIISYLGERGEEYENVILGDKDQNLLRFILLQHVANIKLGSTDLRNNMNIKTLAENTKTILDTRDGLTIAGKPFTVRNHLIFFYGILGHQLLSLTLFDVYL